MSDDKELLELAAKAAELGVVWVGDLPHIKSGEYFMYIWNPLTDDGDALRLAVKLRLHAECCNSGIVYVWIGSELVLTNADTHDNSDLSRYAATRRAIVRAAAEIGKGMR